MPLSETKEIVQLQLYLNNLVLKSGEKIKRDCTTTTLLCKLNTDMIIHIHVELAFRYINILHILHDNNTTCASHKPNARTNFH